MVDDRASMMPLHAYHREVRERRRRGRRRALPWRWIVQRRMDPSRWGRWRSEILPGLPSERTENVEVEEASEGLLEVSYGVSMRMSCVRRLPWAVYHHARYHGHSWGSLGRRWGRSLRVSWWTVRSVRSWSSSLVASVVDDEALTSMDLEAVRQSLLTWWGFVGALFVGVGRSFAVRRWESMASRRVVPFEGGWLSSMRRRALMGTGLVGRVRLSPWRGEAWDASPWSRRPRDDLGPLGRRRRWGGVSMGIEGWAWRQCLRRELSRRRIRRQEDDRSNG